MLEQHRKLAHLIGAQGIPDDRAMNGVTTTGDSESGQAEFGAGQIRKEITAEVLPIIAASEKPDRGRRPRCSKLSGLSHGLQIVPET